MPTEDEYKKYTIDPKDMEAAYNANHSGLLQSGMGGNFLMWGLVIGVIYKYFKKK